MDQACRARPGVAMKRPEAPLTLRDILRRRGVLSSTSADLEERAHVATRFGLLASAFARQRTAEVYHIGHRTQRTLAARRIRRRAA
jgi:hypothetical protein